MKMTESYPKGKKTSLLQAISPPTVFSKDFHCRQGFTLYHTMTTLNDPVQEGLVGKGLRKQLTF